MAFFLRAGGTLLISGTLLYVVGSFVSIRRAQMAFAVGELAGNNPGWSQVASQVGIALMVLGLLVALTVLFTIIRNALTRKT